MDINPKIFREYDIRGIVGQDLDDGAVEILGRAMGTFFLGRGQKQVAVGQDCRLSSPGFARALTSGLASTGCDVTPLGVVPTPLLYFSVFHKKMPAGVMITGSHNPPEHNGFKMMSGHDTLYGFGPPRPNSEVRASGTYGVLEITLRPRSYEWRFLPASGTTFADAGSDTCH